MYLGIENKGLEYATFDNMKGQQFDIHVHDAIVDSGVPNSMGCEIPLRSKLNILFFRQ